MRYPSSRIKRRERNSALKGTKINLRPDVELRAGTGRVRFKVHNKSAVDALIPMLDAKRGSGDITQNRVVIRFPKPDVPAVVLVGLGCIRRVSTANGGAWTTIVRRDDAKSHKHANTPRRMTGPFSGRPLRRSSALVNPETVRTARSPEYSRLVVDWKKSHPISSLLQSSVPGTATPATAVARAAKAGRREKIRIVCGLVGKRV